MNFIGEYIRKKRISKKISLDTVCNELKISKYVIQKIENDDFDKTVNEENFETREELQETMKKRFYENNKTHFCNHINTSNRTTHFPITSNYPSYNKSVQGSCYPPCNSF